MSVALGIQYAMRMWPITLSPVTCPILQNSSTLSHKRHNVGVGEGGGIEHEIWVLIFSKTFVKNMSHCRDNLARYSHKGT